MSTTVDHRGDVDARPATDVQAAATDTHPEKVYVPSSTPGAAIAGVALGIALLGVFAVAVRELILETGLISGSSWSQETADGLGAQQWREWMWPIAIALIVIGLLALWLAAKPRRRTHLRLAGYEVVWTRPGDVARRTSAAVKAVPGVDHAVTVIRRRSAKVAVVAEDSADPDAIRAAATSVLGGLEKPLTPKISLRTRGHHTRTHTAGGDHR